MCRINRLAGPGTCALFAAVGLLVWLAAFTPAVAAENLLGKRVTVIHWGAEFHDQNNSVIGTSELGKTYEVYAVKVKKLFVRECDGYLLRTDVVPYEGASDHFTLQVKRKPSADTYYDRGCFLQNEHLPDDALKDYNEALRRNPKHANAYNARAGVCWWKGELDKALEDYTQALNLDRKHYAAYVNRGRVWVDKRDDERAMSDFDDAIRINRVFPPAYAARAGVWTRQSDFDKAIDDYDQAIRLDPTQLNSLLERGRVWYLKEDSKKALDDFNEVIRRDPKNQGAYLSRGAVWAHDGGFISAAADYERLMELDSGSVVAHVSMALLLAACPDANVRDGKRAMEIVEKLKHLVDWRNSSEYYETLAAASAELGDFEQAVEWQSRMVRRLHGEAKDAAEERLKLYQDKKPYRLTVQKPGKPTAANDPDGDTNGKN